MPALTNNRFGSSWISGAEGTTVWPFFSKNASQRRRISAVSMENQSSGVMGATGHGHATSYAGARRWVGPVRAVGMVGARGPLRSSLAGGVEQQRPSLLGRQRTTRVVGPEGGCRGTLTARPVAVPAGVDVEVGGLGPRGVAGGPAGGVGLDGHLDRLAQLGLAARRGLLVGGDEALGDRQLPQGVADPDRRGGQQHGAAPHDGSLRPSPRTAVRTP